MTLLLHVQIVRCPSTGRILLTGETDDEPRMRAGLVSL